MIEAKAEFEGESKIKRDNEAPKMTTKPVTKKV